MSDTGSLDWVKNFWASGLIRGAVVGLVGGIAALVKAVFDIDISPLVEKIVDALIALAIIVSSVLLVRGRIQKPNRPTITPESIPLGVATLTGTGPGADTGTG